MNLFRRAALLFLLLCCLLPDSAAFADAAHPEEDLFADSLFLGDSLTGCLNEYIRKTGCTAATVMYMNGLAAHGVVDGSTFYGNGREYTLSEAVSSGRYDRIFVMLGSNDLNRRINGTVRCMIRIADTIRELSPDSEICFQSCPPTRQYSFPFDSGNVEKYNRALEKACVKNGVTYIRITDGMADDSGDLAKGLTFDGLHLNNAGCELWMNNLKKFMVEREPG